MSNIIDERVVSMQFDNQHFMSNVRTTMNAIDNLKEGLNFKGATKGLETIDAAAKKVTMAPLASSVETVGLKFNALYTIADQALRNITNSAMNAGKKVISALTIDPIKTGFSEYETQINAVQTILANTESKGTTLDDVNSALDELNTYADKTIYNFTEMTRNIGTFTAAGVELDTSVNAIQGIANLAAVSGSTSQQASTAMYQLSQALSSGTVKLMDWNSVVNAGMGGQVFQDALKETARVHGIAIDDMITKNGSFRETLQEGWLTADILTETLSHFTMAAEEGTEQWNEYKKSLMDSGYSEEQANAILKLSNTATNAATKVKTATQLWDTLKESAQSGWTQTWELIAGDFEEAKSLYSDIYNMISPVIEASAKARNELLEGALTSNWGKMIKTINEAGIETTAFEAKLRETCKAYKVDIDALIEEHGSLEKAFRSGAISSDILKSAVKGLSGSLIDLKSIERELKFGDTGEDVKKVQEALKALKYDIGDAGVDGSLGPATEQAIKAFQEAQGLEVTGIIDDKTLAALDEASVKVQDLSGSVDGLIDGITELGGRELLIESLKNVFEGVKSVVKPLREAFRDIFPPMTSEQLYKLIEGFHKFTEKLIIGDTTSKNLKRAFKGLFAILDIVKQAFSAIFGVISPLFGGLDDLGGSILDTTASWGDWLVNLNETIKTTNFFGNAVAKIKDALSTAYEAAKSFFSPVIETLKEFGEAFTDTFSSIAGKADRGFAPLTAIGNVVLGIFKAIGAVLVKMAPWMAKFASMVGNVFTDLMDRISSSIQDADYSKLFDIMNGGIFAAIGVGIARFTKFLGDAAAGISTFKKGLIDILDGVAMSLEAFSTTLKAEAIKEIAIAIAILAGSLFVISIIDSEKLNGALGAITVMFVELMGSISLFEKAAGGMKLKTILGVSSALKGLATALLIMSLALKVMSTMSWEELAVGLTAMTVCLGELILAVHLLPEKKVNGAAKAIKKISTAMVILGIALKIMGSMSWKEMGVGLISMTAALAAMVAAVNLLPKDTGLRAAGMVGLATAMVILGAALKIMGSMSWKEMGVGLITLVGALAAITIAMRFMPKDIIFTSVGLLAVATAITILAGALKIMGSMSLAEVGKGLLALGGSLAIVAIGVNLMNGAIPGAAAMLIVAAAISIFAPALMLLGSMSLGEIGKGLLALAGVFAVLGIAGLLLAPIIPAILGLAAAVALLGIGITAIGVGVALFAVAIGALGTALGAAGGAIVLFVASLIGLIPYFIEQVGVGIIKLCEVISGSAAAICEALKVIVLAAIDTLVTCIPAIVEGVLELIVSLLETLNEYLPKIVPALVTLFGTLIDLVIENMDSILDPVFKFLVALLDGIASRLGDLTEPLVNLLVVLFQGLADILGPIINEVIAPLLSVLVDLISNLFESIAPYIPDICELFREVTTVITEAFVKIVETISPYIPYITAAVIAICDIFTTLFEQISPIIQSITDLIRQLGDSISQIIGSICEVIESFGSVIETVLQGVADIIESVGEVIADYLGGWAEIFDSAFGGIAEVLESVGSGIQKVLDGIAGVIKSIGEAALNAGTGFEKLANGVKTITKLNLADMAASLAAVATGVGKIAAHSSKLSTAGDGMKKIADSTKTSSTSFDKISKCIDTLLDNLAKLEPEATKAVTGVTTSITKLAQSLSTISVQVMSETMKIITAVSSMGSACATAIMNFRGSFISAGMYLIDGLAAGIKANKPAALRAAQNVADAVESTIRAAWEVNSPSKLFYRIASGVPEGMVNAFGDGVSVVKRSAGTLATSVTKGLGGAMQQISEALSSDIDSQPTITPVLDLSNITSGANAISGLFSGRRTLTIDTGMAGVVASAMSQHQNGADNSDVVSSLKALRKDLANMPRESITIEGITYDDGSNITDAVQTLVRAAKIERRV